MSMLQGLASTLAEMGFVQLSLLFFAVGGYSLAINGALGGGVRGGAASVAFASGAAFSALAPSWMGGVVFLGIAVLAVAAFAALAWMTAAVLGLGSERGPLTASEERVPERAPALHALQLVRGLAAGLMRSH